jgi:type IV secretory pathway component VirB8
VLIHLHVITNLLLVTLIFKVCKIAKGQCYLKQLNQGKQKADFLKGAKKNPYEREQAILQVIIDHICV